MGERDDLKDSATIAELEAQLQRLREAGDELLAELAARDYMILADDLDRVVELGVSEFNALALVGQDSSFGEPVTPSDPEQLERAARAMKGYGWEVRGDDDSRELVIQRGTSKDGNLETAVACWDYDLACIIEAVLNFRDGYAGLNVTTREATP